MQENYKPINDKYLISEEGEVLRRLAHDYRPIKHMIDDKSYPFVTLSINGKRKNKKIHRLIAEYFIPNPLNLPVVLHIDNNPLNFKKENLKWGTYLDNNRQCHLEYRNNTKSVYQYTVGGNFISEFKSVADAQRDTGIDKTGISHCCRGKRNYAGGFIWKYAN